ncbi:MAG TPA: lysophospholipid acyltransferase family protein [Burkholderiaceae bacterium]|nr:lysophospholipid acyltransferase family protein [Burkholderiaceae bacterium]
MLVWLFRTIARLPLGWLHGAGAIAGRIALALPGGYRRKSLANLRQAGLYSPERLAAVAVETGKGVAEVPYVWFRSAASLAPQLHWADPAAVAAARAAGTGVILLTPHVGCFEACARAFAQLGPITVLYKPPKIAALRRLVEQARSGPNLASVPTDSRGVRGLLRALKRGETIGMLPDQVPSDGDGIWAPFFGRPAYTMTLPQRLAQATGARVLLVAGQRLPGGRGWTIHAEPLEDVSPAGVNAAMEMLIRRFPEQYFWGYNRYKVPPRARPPQPS